MNIPFLSWRFVAPGLLLPLAFLAFFWQLGTPPLYDLDEGAFAEATREMIVSGNYIMPRKDGEPRYDKPILIYWLQAAAVHALGLDELALRLPSALAASLWLLAIWSFARERLDDMTALVAGAIMALSLEIGLIGRAAIADAVLNLFIALAFFDIYRYRLAPAAERPGWSARVYLWLALGFLTKGPIAVLFPFVTSLLYFLSLRDWATWRQAILAPRGWLILLLIVAPWHVAIYLDNGAGFFVSFFLKHNLGRFGGTIHGHAGFPGYYLVMLPLILLPFSGWLLALPPRLRSLWEDPLDRFLLLWFGCVFVFFSFSRTQLPHYLVYGLTPLFILMARHREHLRNPWLAFLPPALFMALLVLLPEILALLARATTEVHRHALFAEGRRLLDLEYRLATGAAFLTLIALWRCVPGPLWQRLILAGALQTLVVYGIALPRVLAALQEPVKEAGLLARALHEPTVVYRTSMPSFSVYRQAIALDRAPRAGDLVFLRIDKWPSLQERLGAERLRTVYRRGAVALVRVVPTNE